MTPTNPPTPSADKDALREWFVKCAEFGNALDRDDGTIGSIEANKNYGQLMQLFDRYCEAAAKEDASLSKIERFEYEDMKRQRTENYDYARELENAPVGSPERLVKHISYLSPWNLRNAVEVLRDWRDEAVAAAEIAARVGGIYEAIGISDTQGYSRERLEQYIIALQSHPQPGKQETER